MPAVPYIPRYNVQDFLGWEGDWELWDGVPISMSPSPSFFHQQVGANLLVQLAEQLKDEPCDHHCLAVYETDWHVSEHTVVRPDVVVICTPPPTGKWIESPPELICEILSPATRQKDLTEKKELYALSGVEFYLILDPENKSATLFQLENGTYREIAPNSPIELHSDCMVTIDVEAVFR